MRSPSRVSAVVAATAAALLLVACGGSDERVETSPAPAPREAKDKALSKVERQPKAKSAPRSPAEDRPTNNPKGNDQTKDAGRKAKSEPGDDTRGAADRGGDSDGGRSDAEKHNDGRRDGQTSPACPKGMSSKQCAEAGRALEGSGSHPVPSDVCSQAIDAATCEQAGKAFAEAKNGGRLIQPGECPRAMTAEQCREAGEAYAEATD